MRQIFIIHFQKQHPPVTTFKIIRHPVSPYKIFNTSTHINKIDTQLSKHPHIKIFTHTQNHTLKNQQTHTPTQYNTHTTTHHKTLFLKQPTMLK